MYQPKIADEHIPALYQWAKRLEMPMTHLVNALLAHALVRLEQGVETVNEPAGRACHQQEQERGTAMNEGAPERILRTPDGSEFVLQPSESAPSGIVRIVLELTLELSFNEQTEDCNRVAVLQARLMSQW
jgi:hypothetical protein